MVRAAAKNYNFVTVVTKISQYEGLVENIYKNKGSTSLDFRKNAAMEAFGETAFYESLIYKYFNQISSNEFPNKIVLGFNLLEKLRYGENPHQKGAIYTRQQILGKKLNGKQLSYNNYVIFSQRYNYPKVYLNVGTVIVKHGNPCGVSLHKNNIHSFMLAHKCVL